MATYQFQTEVNQLLKLIIHSMYSNKDIFLREIVSNASDAIDKLKYLTVSDENFKSIKFEPRIDISFDEGSSILTVQDSGIGMNEKDLSDNLGTIARSGTKAFIEKIAEDKTAGESNLIGQFGVGFYSAFMAAKKIDVDQYLKLEQEPNIDYILPTNSIVTLKVKLDDFYQLSPYNSSITGSISDISTISKKDLVKGSTSINYINHQYYSNFVIPYLDDMFFYNRNVHHNHDKMKWNNFYY